MSIRSFVFTLAALLCASAAAQSAACADSVFLKNGSSISCDVVIATTSAVTVDDGRGNRVVFPMSDVERVVRGAAAEPAASSAREAANGTLGCPARGYRGFVDVNQTFGSLIIEGHGMGGYSQFGLLTSHGYQFSPHFFLGTGFGFLWQEGDRQRSEYDFIFSFFKDFRYDILARRATPFVDLRLGGFISDDFDYDGFYSCLSAGVRRGRINASLGFQFLCNAEGVFGLQEYEEGYLDMEHCEPPGFRVPSFVLSVGCDFGRRR